MSDFDGTTFGATIEPGENNNPELAAHNQRGTVWWKWTSPAGGMVEFFAYSDSVPLAAGAFTGTSVSNLSTISEPFSDIFFHPNATVEAGGAFFNAVSNTSYWFAVMPKNDSTEPAGDFHGTFHFRPSAPPPPPLTNDAFADRTLLTGMNLTVEGDNSAASTEAGEDIGGGTVFTFYSVWYSYTAPTGGVLRISGSTSVPSFYMSIGMYRGTAIDQLVGASGTPDGGIALMAGDTIVIRVASIYYPVWGGGGGRGPFTLNLKLELPSVTSPNDAFAQALSISSTPYYFDGSIYGATNEPGEPLPVPDAQETLWWNFLAPDDGLLNILVSAGQFQALVAVYEGAELPGLIRLNPFNGSRFVVQAGRRYAIQLAAEGVASGDFGLEVRFHPKTNDFFTGSHHLEGTNLTYHGNFTLATFEPGEPTPVESNTVWASWVAPATGSVVYNLARTPQLQYHGVYTGPALGHLSPVAIVPLINRWYTFLAHEGTIYHFQFCGGADDFTLTLQLDPLLPATNDNFDEAEEVKGEVVYFSPSSVMGATMELGEPRHRGAEPQKSVWWKWQIPRSGALYWSAASSLIRDAVIAAYQGSAVEALTLVGKGTNELRMQVKGGEVYYFAGAVPADAEGDIRNYAQVSVPFKPPSVAVPGNLLQEPSWEGTALGPQYWGMSGPIGGYVNEPGGADGATWPTLGNGARVWQDFPTVPGHNHAIRFAFGGDGARIRVLWDDRELGIATVPAGEGFWHWAEFTAYASNAISRVTFESIGALANLDAFSVISLNDPARILTEPSSLSAVAGGSATFIVGASGSPPLHYQWFLDGSPLSDSTNRILVLDPVTAADAGNYTVVVSNMFGMAGSTGATLAVDAPTNATILVQPYGSTAPAGSYFNLSVLAAGTPPLTYRWFKNGNALMDATNRNLALTNVQSADAGVYEVLVQNYGGSVWSLPATVTVSSAANGGGLIDFRNRPSGLATQLADAPIFDIDGMTRLNGSHYAAQLYAGPALEAMHPAGQPSPFHTGFDAGYFFSQYLSLADVPPGGNAFCQVRVWETARGSSYEEARALGGRFGRSAILQIQAGEVPGPGALLTGLQSFSLQAGLPRLNVGLIEFVERQPGGQIVWALQGEPGFRYVVEKSVHTGGLLWRPYLVLTNLSGTVTFTDSANSGSSAAFYRSRILD